MNRAEDIIICADDARALSAMLDRPVEQAAAIVAETFGGAEIVAAARMPADVGRLNAPVEYREVESGAKRCVTLVAPADADPALKRVSVFSPVGRALFGRAVGSFTEAKLPNGQTLELEILHVGPVEEPARADAAV